MTKQHKVQLVDLEKIIADKNPKLLKIMPSFLLNYMKRTVHQNEINRILIETQNLYAYDFVEAIIKSFEVEIITSGLHHIPESGGCTIASNHPLGGLDGLTVLGEVGKRRKDSKAMVNDIIMNLVNLQSLLIPTNKHGKNSADSVNLINETYASGECIIIFPAGLVSRKQGRLIKDLQWKKSFITKAIKHQHSVVPVYVDGRNSKFFYNLAYYRKKLGIKANIEMFYLIDEVFKQKGKPIKITFGEPIPYTKFTKDFSHDYWATKVKEHVYAMKEGKKIL